MSFTKSRINYAEEWRERVDAVVHAALPDGAPIADKDYREAVYKAYPAYLLFCFCEKYRQQHATYWQPMPGLVPAQLRLIEKHHWLPDQAFALGEDRLLLLLHEELAGLRLPAQAHEKLSSDFEYLHILDIELNQADSLKGD